ncbi:hypothetical protein PCCS19_05560 [Paenibacillus sp. CCS19]|uniref:CLC_0170 family protein n=1 Tax=Paenibacillus sp. CCS19 TaxID=3158387 RepID=UPI00256C1238|nr:CLC_0170 family protein [Paenibacillus cellulosilyticus]GMK37502.1 hypothetical protein PCCS19_05560 [Paenibacillus cellulosilyticus]
MNLLVGYTVNFIGYAIPLLLFSGFMILRVDRVQLKKNKMTKEQKFSTVLGVTNIVLACSFYVLKVVLF